MRYRVLIAGIIGIFTAFFSQHLIAPVNLAAGVTSRIKTWGIPNGIRVNASRFALLKRRPIYLAALIVVAVGASAMLAESAHAQLNQTSCSLYQSNLTLSSTTVVAGASVTASGSCFSPNDTVTFELDSVGGSPLATSPTDPSGAFANVNVPIPVSVTAGSHAIYAVDTSGDNASAPLTVTAPAATATPTQTPVGSVTGTPTPTPTGTPKPLSYHVYMPSILNNYPTTNILIANKGLGDVTEVNWAGQIVWQITGLNQPYRAERLANGDTLIPEYGANRVIEITRSGQIVWSYSIPLPVAAHRLANGNTLITGGTATTSAIDEVSPSGQVVWSYNYYGYCYVYDKTTNFCLGYPSDAIRLANGNTLIAVNDSGVGLLEVDPNDNVVMQRQVNGANGSPMPIASVHELASGNWLITTTQDLGARVVEQTTNGADVCSYGSVDYSALYFPMDAWRTGSGTTLIADQGHDRILEVGCGNNIIWQYYRKGSQPGSVEEVNP